MSTYENNSMASELSAIAENLAAAAACLRHGDPAAAGAALGDLFDREGGVSRTADTLEAIVRELNHERIVFCDDCGDEYTWRRAGIKQLFEAYRWNCGPTCEGRDILRTYPEDVA